MELYLCIEIDQSGTLIDEEAVLKDDRIDMLVARASTFIQLRKYEAIKGLSVAGLHQFQMERIPQFQWIY